MAFWDWVEHFRETILRDHPSVSTKAAYLAVKYLRSILEPNWIEAESGKHPLMQRLRYSAEPNDLWLDQFARKIAALKQIDGSGSIIARLARWNQFSGARYEMDVCLMMLLAGFKPELVQPTPAEPSVDIRVHGPQDQFLIEVTSLNPSNQDDLFMEFVNWTTGQSFGSGVIAGGLINGTQLAVREIPNMKIAIKEAVGRAKDAHSLQQVNFPGTANIYIAPSDLVGQMPEGMRGMFGFTPPYDRSFEEKVTRKIQSKMAQLSQTDLPVILSIFSQIHGYETLKAIFEKGRDDIEVVIGTIPQLMALVLSESFPLWTPQIIEAKIGTQVKTLFVSDIGIREPYAFLSWRNGYSTRIPQEEVLGAFERYSTNLANLNPLA